MSVELETAARRRLLADPTVNGYVAGRVFKNTLLVSPDGDGGYAIVVRRMVGWAAPLPRNTAEFPRLVVECWADVDRDDLGVKRVDNSIDKAWALYRAVDRLLHGIRDQWWGAGGSNPGLRIVSCVRDSEPEVEFGPDAAATGRPAVFGDMAMVPAIYDVHTVH